MQFIAAQNNLVFDINSRTELSKQLSKAQQKQMSPLAWFPSPVPHLSASELGDHLCVPRPRVEAGGAELSGSDTAVFSVTHVTVLMIFTYCSISQNTLESIREHVPNLGSVTEWEI